MKDTILIVSGSIALISSWFGIYYSVGIKVAYSQNISKKEIKFWKQIHKGTTISFITMLISTLIFLFVRS